MSKTTVCITKHRLLNIHSTKRAIHNMTKSQWLVFRSCTVVHSGASTYIYVFTLFFFRRVFVFFLRFFARAFASHKHLHVRAMLYCFTFRACSYARVLRPANVNSHTFRCLALLLPASLCLSCARSPSLSVCLSLLISRVRLQWANFIEFVRDKVPVSITCEKVRRNIGPIFRHLWSPHRFSICNCCK